MRRFMRCRGLWIPGVSKKTICPRGSLRMPTMRWRVVWGLSETMASFSASSRLSSVDLPALGRPTRATGPERGAAGVSISTPSSSWSANLRLLLACGRRQRRHAHAARAPMIGALDDEAHAVRLHALPHSRHVSQQAEDQPSHRLPLALGEAHAEELLDLLEVRATIRSEER